LSDIRFSQVATDRHTRIPSKPFIIRSACVDRLAMIEGDLRAARVQPEAPQPVAPQPEASVESSYAAPLAPAYVAPDDPVPAAPQQVAMTRNPNLNWPNPAAMQEHFEAAPREFHASPGDATR